MKKIILLILFPFILISQNKKINFPKDIISKMETKSKPNYLSKYEWDILLYLNYARLYPKEFTYNEIIPYSNKKYTDKKSVNYRDYVKPAIDRMLGVTNKKNNIVPDIKNKLKKIGEIGVLEPNLVYTLAERDFLCDPSRNGHKGSLGNWTVYANYYLELSKEHSSKLKKGFSLGNKIPFMSSQGEIAWPVLPEKMTAKEVIIEFIIDRGNRRTRYGHREIILEEWKKGEVGIACQKSSANSRYKGKLGLHISFGLNYYDKGGLKINTLSKPKKGINKNSKNPKQEFPVSRIPAR